MENLDKLPLPLLVAMGVGMAVIWSVRHMGLLSGERSTAAARSSTAQVAAVIVDHTALVNATTAVDKLTHELEAQRVLAKDNAHMICRRVEALCDEVEGLTGVLDKMILELARKH
ncbi:MULTISPECIES: hypothetical protein [unclassified Rhizobium]|uniref:hypothetical protein n=1 Tax=unclassified Rhizobium TaxID=2613769 RepID=UPI001AD9528D|nr:MULTISPECIES: hypothetical protein [unclassified Rhizobium]MBO9125440.1 hypothetical protein [Rhizobium sp. 16-488-2b]MBO9176025.1 hypothetical protein [Rhizobium sp. 16-488-2a]